MSAILQWQESVLGILGISLFLYFFLFFLIRFSAWYLTWILSRKYEVKVKIGRVGFLSLSEVYLQSKNGTTLEIEKIWCSSNMLHTKYKSLFVLCVNDIRLQGDAEWIKARTTHENSDNETRKITFSPKFISLLKMLSLHVLNASVMQLGTPHQEFLLHASLQELSIFWCSRANREQINVSVVSSAVKIFKHLPQGQDHQQSRSESCLAHLTVNIDVVVHTSVLGQPLMQSVRFTILQPELMLYEAGKISNRNIPTLGLSFNKLKKQVSSGLNLQDIDDPLSLSSKLPKSISEPYSSTLETDETIKLDKTLRKFPEATFVKIESFSIKLMKEGGHRAFTMDIKLVEAELKKEAENDSCELSSLTSSFVIEELLAASGPIQFAQLIRASVNLKMQNHLLNTNIQLSCFHLSYQREILQYWLNILPVHTKEEDQNLLRKNRISQKQNSFWHCLKNFRVRNTTELEDVSISAKLPGCAAFSLGLTHGRCSLDGVLVFLGPGDRIRQSSFPSGDLSLEILLETAYFKIGESNSVDSGTMKRYHFWNTPLSFGMLLLKGRLHPSDYCVQCMLDSIQIEWSPNLASLIQDFCHFIKEKDLTGDNSSYCSDEPNLVDEETPIELSMQKKSPLFLFCSLQLNFSGINIFGLSETNTAIVLRTDMLNLESSGDKINISMEGCKLAPVSPTIQSYPCVKSSDIKSFVVHLANVSLAYRIEQKEASLQVSDDIRVFWNSTFHLTVLNIAQDISAFKDVILSNQNKSTNVRNQQTPSTFSFLMKAQGNISIGILLSRMHRIVFSTSELTANITPIQKSAQTRCIFVIFDDHPVFTFQQLVISLTQGSEQHILNRQSFDGLELCNNRILNIQMEEAKIVFPYQYNFAGAFNEQLIGTVKWLKIIHKVKKKTFSINSPLPPDLSIKIKSWIIEIEDDPFEVKLRDNFELLDDEYHESLKRKRMLDEKIENLRRTNLLLPGEKINELYSKLAKKNAEIYIQRSRQLYQRGPMRTSLVVWQLENVEILAIADTSYHGTENVTNIIKSIDSDSPFPEEGIEFTILWCRRVRCSALSWICNLRDFPQPLLLVRELHIWGLLIGAEQEASQRAKRTSIVEIGEPWVNATIERSMTSLKFYHDLTFDIEDMCAAYGPCWEPLMAQIGLAFEYISKPSLDPSPVLPWWDKIRLLYHGRVIFSVQHLALLLHASLDPYNTTEEMEITWSDVIIEWTNGKILTKGDLDMYVHTASKYDDCRLLHIPSLKLSVSVDWLSLGNPNDHHSVMPCAPDKIPEYSINQVHDSYRAFRSQNLNVSFSFETRHVNLEATDIPTMLLYSSTLRWIENLKMILSGVTRLTRRGKLFSNTKPRKPQLSRHYRNLRVSLNLHKFQICYWMSFAKQRGLELLGGRLSLSSEHTQSLVPISDGLQHRPRSAWSIGYLNCELCDSEIWLYNCVQMDVTEEAAKSLHAPVERSYFLSVNRVSYGREEIVKDVVPDEDKADTPTHRLVVHGLKGAWTKHNRGVIFSLFDSYMKAVVLKRNLSTEALKSFKVEPQNTPQKVRTQTSSSQNSTQAAPSPVSHLQSGHAASMLQKLIAEAEVNPMVFTEEIEGTIREQQLHGVAACQTDDVLHKNWLIELVNSQVMLRGCETSGYVIVSAAKAQILQRIHRPVWKDRTLVSKTTWVGSLECMQYYATVDAGEPGPSVDNVMWLSVDNIEERESMVISDLPDIVGSGHSVGGVVSNTVGAASDPTSAPIQLQRIVSRCGCQFFYASFGENVDSGSLEEVPPLPEDIDLWEQEVAVDSFTLTHHDLELCTNSLQYAMILDLVNNLLLYVEPRKKEAIEKLQYMRFQLQLCSVDDQRKPILQLQENVRYLVSNLRRLEKEAYMIHRLICDHPEREDYLQEFEQLENKLYECKEQLNTMNEELTMMISCFKETQIIASRSRQRASSQEKGVAVVRRSEVCFKHAQWRLTDADGQLGIADLVLSNFLYSKVTKSDDSVEHLLELGYVKVNNLLPNQPYKHVLQPSEVHTKIPLDRQKALRIYCRERAPVGGISIKEHLEVNVIPITIGLTDAFYSTMLKFFFPGRDTEKEDRDEEQEATSSHNKKHSTLGHQKGSSTFYGDRDDIEKMKERADKNHTFFYVKIPEVPLCVSYKGKKEKNIKDVHELSLVLSTLEYHNRTWTWLDLLMELKNDAKKVLLSQVIKQKLLKPKQNSPEKDNQPQEEDKAHLLLPSSVMGVPQKKNRRKFFP